VRTTTLIILAAVLAGCAKTATSDFVVQDGIKIAVPIRNVSQLAAFQDGGTMEFRLTDGAGKKMLFYEDHRLQSKTPGAIYLFAHPNKTNSIRVTNEVEFRKIVRFQ
jgi:hypothetical protein